MEEKLIEAVRARKVLYDTSHEACLKTELQAEKWEEVAKEAGLRSGAEAKTVWEELRHSLRDALRRQQKCRKSGPPAEFVEQWKFQKQMGFLQPYMTNGTGKGKLNECIDDSETPSQNCGISCPIDVVEDHDESFETQQGIRNGRDESQLQALPEISPPTQTPISAKNMDEYIIAGLLKGRVKQREELRKSRSQERKRTVERTSASNDALYHFFSSIYEATKNMPPLTQSLVRNDIFRVVTEIEATLPNMPARSPQSNTVQRPSYHELSQCSAKTARQSHSSLSNPIRSSPSDSPFQNPEENCEFEQNATNGFTPV